jgi:NAD(P)-dependent dehydrogenase (short-subunit alcohol dehydrogenase family)
MSDNVNMSDKLAVVTGANSGIGKITARELARLGAQVVMVCRDRARGETARDEIIRTTGSNRVELMDCDLSSQADVRRFADEFKARHKRLDVLVNNAGVYLRKRAVTVDGLEATFAVNHLGYFLLTNLLVDLLKQSAPARVVNVSSGAHAHGHINFDDLQGEQNYSGVKAYCHSKLANILFTRELARRLAGTGVTANCLHPGAVATGIFRALPKPLEALIKLVTISPEKGAETSIYLASSPAVETVTGKYFIRCVEARASAEAQDDDVARHLWAESARLTHLTADAVKH